MKVASQAGTGEDSHRQLVSPLEETLDAAVESERHLSALARRARAAEWARALTGPSPAARPLARGTEAKSVDSARPPARLPASPLAWGGARAEAAPLARRPASEGSGLVRAGAVALGLVAVLTASLLPVLPTSPVRTTVELGALSTRTPVAPAERASDVLGPGAPVARRAPQRADTEQTSHSSMQRPSEAPDGAGARATLDSEARGPGGVSAAAVHSDPSRSSPATAAPRAQAAAAHVPTEKRAGVITVDDLFGIGGDEPVPPEALDAPAPAPPPPSRARKPAHAAAAASSLFYQKLPF